jgi:hypothetical protein
MVNVWKEREALPVTRDEGLLASGGQYRHGERAKAAIAEQRKFSALLKMLRAGLT